MTKWQLIKYFLISAQSESHNETFKPEEQTNKHMNKNQPTASESKFACL